MQFEPGSKTKPPKNVFPVPFRISAFESLAIFHGSHKCNVICREIYNFHLQLKLMRKERRTFLRNLFVITQKFKFKYILQEGCVICEYLKCLNKYMIQNN